MLMLIIFILGIICFVKLMVKAASMMAGFVLVAFALVILISIALSPYIFVGLTILALICISARNKKADELSA